LKRSALEFILGLFCVCDSPELHPYPIKLGQSLTISTDLDASTQRAEKRQANDPEMVKFMEQYFPTRANLKAKFPGYPNN
ncbi:hypothetical protein AB4178_04260, partial [Vibrio splendidus]